MLKPEAGDNHCQNVSAGSDRAAAPVDSGQYGCLQKTASVDVTTWVEEKGLGRTWEKLVGKKKG